MSGNNSAFDEFLGMPEPLTQSDKDTSSTQPKQEQLKTDEELEEDYEYNLENLKASDKVHVYLERALSISRTDENYQRRLLELVIDLGITQSDPTFLLMVAVNHLRFLMEEAPRKQKQEIETLKKELNQFRTEFNQQLSESEQALSDHNYRRSRSAANRAIAELQEALDNQLKSSVERLVEAGLREEMRITTTYEKVATKFEERIKNRAEKTAFIATQDRVIVITVLVLFIITGLMIGAGGALILFRSNQSSFVRFSFTFARLVYDQDKHELS